MRALALPLLVIGTILTFACEDGPLYVQKNEALLATLPVPSGASVDRSESYPYYEYETDNVVGYTTNTVYSVLDETTDAAVVEFYIEALSDGWVHCRDEIGVIEAVPAGAPTQTPQGFLQTVHFVRDGALVSVSPHAFGAITTYELVVDHNTRSDPCTGEALR